MARGTRLSVMTARCRASLSTLGEMAPWLPIAATASLSSS